MHFKGWDECVMVSRKKGETKYQTEIIEREREREGREEVG